MRLQNCLLSADKYAMTCIKSISNRKYFAWVNFTQDIVALKVSAKGRSRHDQECLKVGHVSNNHAMGFEALYLQAFLL